MERTYHNIGARIVAVMLACVLVIASLPTFVFAADDVTAPTGDISFQDVRVTTNINATPAEHLFNQTVEITITASDDVAVSLVEYHRSPTPLTEAEVNALPATGWQAYSGPIVETPVDGASFIYYVRVMDSSGNTRLFSSSMGVFDTQAPTISGVVDGFTYYASRDVVIHDTNLSQVTVNDMPVSVTANPLTWTLPGGATSSATFVLTASDAAGNSTTSTVTVDVPANAGNSVAGITTESVQMNDKTELETALDDLNTILSAPPVGLTQADLTAMQEKVASIEQTLNVITTVETVNTTVTSLPASIEPDDLNEVLQIEDLQKKLETLNAHGQSLIAADIKTKLDDLIFDMTDYRVVGGDTTAWSPAAGGDYVIIINGALEKFQGIQLNGAPLPSEYYTLASGSTIITLRESFLQSLESSMYSITVLYDNGQITRQLQIANAVSPSNPNGQTGSGATLPMSVLPVSTSANVNAGANTEGLTPATGDNLDMLAVLVLLGISAIVAGGAAVQSVRSRASKRH